MSMITSQILKYVGSPKPRTFPELIKHGKKVF